MGTRTDKTPRDSTDPIDRLRGGDQGALAELFAKHRDQLRRMVELRIDERLRTQLDPSDILQKAFLDISHDLSTYLANPALPPLLWLRLHVGQRLTTLHHQHLGTKMRDAGLKISLYHGALPEANPAALAAQRAERLLRLQEALNSLNPIDREVLALRHFEQLGRVETAQVLRITQEAGAKRYFRALKRLKDVLATLPGGWESI
jgi:RNA polymerase sigma-70 factor (ECF subfamily)